MAIKHPHSNKDGKFTIEQMELFLDEVKSMLEVKDYHENIVNLQGVIYGQEDELRGLPKVM